MLDFLLSPFEFAFMQRALLAGESGEILGQAVRRLEEAGVPVCLLRCNGMVHGFASMIGFLHRATLHMGAACWELRRMVEREEEKESDLAVV